MMYDSEQTEVDIEESVDVEAFFESFGDDEVETEIAADSDCVEIVADCDDEVETEIDITQDNIEITTLSDVDESVRVQLITGLDLIYALPPGGTEGQILVKNSDKSQDVSWVDMPAVEPSQPGQSSITKYPLAFVPTNDTFECLIPAPYRIISVKDNSHNDILYESVIVSNGIKIVVETEFRGYALVY